MTEAVRRRIRRAARIVLIGPDGRVLLFRYIAPKFDPFWILPGGACDEGEDFPSAAARELREETGIATEPQPIGLIREAEYDYLGEPVKSVEHFFHWRTASLEIDTSGHTELEREVMREHRWFTSAELSAWPETIYPLDLRNLVEGLARR